MKHDEHGDRKPRTAERQKELLGIARTCRARDVTTAIRRSDIEDDDMVTMVRIVTATYEDEAWEMFNEADDVAKELLLDVIERTTSI